MQYIGQKGQDKWIIEDVFKFKRGGYFVDLASTDGVSINNTILLEKEFGWRGICIEANSSYYEALVTNRICKCVNACVDEREGIVRFLPNGELGGIVDDDTDNNMANRRDLIKSWSVENKIKDIPARTFESILDECQAPKVIDYLSFDVEGAETRIFRSFPFEKYIFLAMTIERPSSELNDLLFSKGFIFVKNQSFDTFYVHKTIPGFSDIEKVPFVQIPPKDW